jgi:hypothetical protein
VCDVGRRSLERVGDVAELRFAERVVEQQPEPVGFFGGHGKQHGDAVVGEVVLADGLAQPGADADEDGAVVVGFGVDVPPRLPRRNQPALTCADGMTGKYERATSAIRLSLGRWTTANDIDRAAALLGEAVISV